MSIERRLVQLNFSAAFDRVRQRGMLNKLKSMSIGGQFLFIVSEFLSDRWQRVRLDGKVSALVDVVLGVSQGSVLGPLLLILYTSELFQFVENYIVFYAEDTTMYAVIPSPLLRSQVME